MPAGRASSTSPCPASGGTLRVSWRLSERTGLHIVMGCGWYRGAYYPAEALIERRSVDDLADELVREATDGVGETGIRPGIIGEIGTDKPWISPAEERVHRAAARASVRTGLGITTHAVMSAVGLAQLRIFEEEGVDPGRVVIGHADSYPVLDHYVALLERGASIEFDFLGMSFTPTERHGEERIAGLVVELLSRGFGGQVLLSQDVCHDSQLKRYEGNGYVHLHESFLPRLRALGVSRPRSTASRSTTRGGSSRSGSGAGCGSGSARRVAASGAAAGAFRRPVAAARAGISTPRLANA